MSNVCSAYLCILLSYELFGQRKTDLIDIVFYTYPLSSFLTFSFPPLYSLHPSHPPHLTPRNRRNTAIKSGQATTIDYGHTTIISYSGRTKQIPLQSPHHHLKPHQVKC
ncbi:hypothetical protein HanRHA438_Chr04g0157011 [Helianthus annuus]|nr:hypothetical protein HanIR_Chr04g0158211 [Helianthus annuus]KAJ0925210.1 hypothetical protein HanRHA438_Chr04g0157011 [Helianthus annuus]